VWCIRNWTLISWESIMHLFGLLLDVVSENTVTN
jgi:hypothetical protein